MKILLTGANGFLGYYLSDLLTNAGLDLLATSRGPCRLPFLLRNCFAYRPLDFTDAALLLCTSTASFKQPAQRPLLTGLCIDKARHELGFLPSSFAEGLKHTFGKV